MQSPNAKYEAPRLYEDGRRERKRSYSGALPWICAATFFAVSLPTSAEAGQSENIAIALSNSIAGSPAGRGDAAHAVPGAIVDFSVSVTGPTAGGSPATSFALVDMVPKHLSLFVGDLGRDGTGPALFKDNDSGLEFSFGGLTDSEDSVEFSSNDGKTFDYVPVADHDGFDHNVTHIKLHPYGALLPASGKHERFSLRYRMKVK
ncbi:hypothetical protein [Parasphingorhabdus sp.]|uniref:hypothetical protein n=1 Tax=Parasphingorhabdus sp. TaxID=2709688 RepID=UPI003A94B963